MCFSPCTVFLDVPTVFCDMSLSFDYMCMRLPFSPLQGVPSSQALPDEGAVIMASLLLKTNAKPETNTFSYLSVDLILLHVCTSKNQIRLLQPQTSCQTVRGGVLLLRQHPLRQFYDLKPCSFQFLLNLA